jgi:geranylgeranylglycerol-phosphate geranylgeranyltransferase
VNALIGFVSVLIGAMVTGTFSPKLNIILAACTVFAVAGGANAANDLCDEEVDRINKPHRSLASGKISRTRVILISSVLFVAALSGGYFLPFSCFVIIVVSIALLILYSLVLKPTGLPGNIAISLVASLPFIMGGIVAGRILPTVIPTFFAFLYHLGREIVKDAQDEQGDRVIDARTLPILFGKEKALSTSIYIFLSLIVLTILPYLFQIYNLTYLKVIFVFNGVLLFVILSLHHNPERDNLGKVSLVLKVNMITGILAILLGGKPPL